MTIIFPTGLCHPNGEIDLSKILTFRPVPVQFDHGPHVFPDPNIRYDVIFTATTSKNEFIVKMNWSEYCVFNRAFMKYREKNH